VGVFGDGRGEGREDWMRGVRGWGLEGGMIGRGGGGGGCCGWWLVGMAFPFEWSF